MVWSTFVKIIISIKIYHWSSNGLVPNGTKPLLEAMMTYTYLQIYGFLPQTNLDVIGVCGDTDFAPPLVEPNTVVILLNDKGL